MPPRILRSRRRLNLENLENRIQPAALPPLRVALISDAVAQAAQIEAAAAKGVVALTYDSESATLDGLVSQLQAVSATHGGAAIGHLGLVAHGHSGAITIGPLETLDRQDALANSPIWDQLRSLLSPNARIDLYACDVAAGRDGRVFVNALARRTGAAVYASTDAVGSVRGADLVWEYNTAVRGRSPLFDPASLKKIAGLVLEDAFEPNNVKAQADVAPGGNSPNLGVLTGQKTLNNLFLAADTADWFRFDTAGIGTTAHYVRIETLDPNGDVDLDVYTQNGVNYVSYAVDGGVEEVSLFGLPPGTYYVRAYPHNAGETTSNYSLQIVAPPAGGDDAYESNDVKADADRAPGLNSPNLGTITSQVTLSNLVMRGNEDWFRFQTAGVGTESHYVRLEMTETSGDLDLDVYVDNGVNYVSYAVDGGVEEVNLFGLPPGTYYVRVYAHTWPQDSSTNYTLQIVPPAAGSDDPYEGNDTKAEADRAPGIHSPNLGLISGSVVLENMVLSGDEDWFRFTTDLPSNGAHYVRLEGIETSGDVDLDVYKSNGTTYVNYAVDGGIEQVDMAAMPAGTYYIRVYRHTWPQSSSSKYTLQIMAPGSGLTVASPTVTEGDGGEINAVFKLTRSDGNGPASVTYETADGTAVAGEDYVAKSDTVNFINGQTTAYVVVKVKGDQLDEDDEDFFLNLIGSSGVTINATQAVGVIRDDDSAGAIQFSLANYNVKELAGTAYIKVTRVGGSDGPVSVYYMTSDGSAVAPGDYTAISVPQRLDFLHGEVSKSFPVSIINDGIPETAESLNLILTNPIGAELGLQSTAELTIHDAPGTLQFSATNYVGGESSAKATITVNRVGGAEGTVTVKYATANKTAIAPGDYTAETGTLTFEDGETTQSFDIEITPDSVFEPNESLTLTLSFPTGGARLGVPRTATLTITNDDDLMSTGTVVVGAGNSGVVKVMDGKTGAVKSTIQAFPVGFKAGVRVATGDVNGDGTADIIAAPGPNGATTVRVFDGTNGSKLTGILGEFAHGLPLAGGVFVAAGDVNGDTKDDIIVGPGSGASPHVKVFDGATRNLLRDIEAFPGTTHGVTLAVADVSGDSTPDIIIGAGAGGPGNVKVYDWSTDSFVNNISAFTGLTGGVNVAAGDVDGDGRADIIVAAGAGGAPHVKAFKGTTGADITLPLPPIYASTFRGGVTIAVGDIDGDGIAELIAGSGPGVLQYLKIIDFSTGQVLKQTLPFGAVATNGTFVAVAR